MLRRISQLVVLVALFGVPLTMRGIDQSPARPHEPISAILDAFRTHQVVGIPDAHRNTAIHSFLLSLIRDPRFPMVVDDVVVEFGNALHQNLVDQFVRGEDVAYPSLRKAWLDTTQAQPAADTPHAEEVIRAVRAVNASLSRERQVRVLLGDPPINWQEVKTKADHLKWIDMRETFPADLIRREVLARNRRALLVYGVGHLQRKNPQANFESAGFAASLVSLLEDSGATRVFNVGLILELPKGHTDAASWPVPSLVALRGTTMGADPVAYDGPRVTVQGGRIASVPRDQWRSMRMEDQFDALLYIGPRNTWRDVMVSPALCADPSYVEMRTRRMKLTEWKADRLEDYCGKVRPPGQ